MRFHAQNAPKRPGTHIRLKKLTDLRTPVDLEKNPREQKIRKRNGGQETRGWQRGIDEGLL